MEATRNNEANENHKPTTGHVHPGKHPFSAVQLHTTFIWRKSLRPENCGQYRLVKRAVRLRHAKNEATKQLLVYIKHLNDPASGLMWHAYDESGQQTWADPSTHHSSFFWCRAIGWFGMALIEVLEVLPHNHPHRQELIKQVVQLTHAYAKYQDSATGLWYEVVDQGTTPGNWLETSSSSMFSYTLYMSVLRKYIPKKFLATACKGYRGVLSQVSKDPATGQVDIANICGGTNVGDLAFYLNRPR